MFLSEIYIKKKAHPLTLSFCQQWALLFNTREVYILFIVLKLNSGCSQSQAAGIVFAHHCTQWKREEGSFLYPGCVYSKT